MEREFARLLDKEVSYAWEVEFLKQSLETLADFSPVSAFRSIDEYEFGYIDYDNLFNFIKKGDDHKKMARASE